MKPTLLLLACALFPACVDSAAPDGPGSSGPGGGKGDDPTENPSPHAAAVQACQATYDEGLGDDPSIPNLNTLAACIVAANTAAVPAIDELVERELDIAGAIAAGTRAADTFCQLMQALEDPDDTFTASLNLASCRVARNLDLGLLLDMHVAFDGYDAAPSFQFPDEAFPDCAAAYKDAIAADDSTAGLIQASAGLADCTEQEIRDVTEPSIVEGLATHGGLSRAAARARFTADLNAVVASIHTTCAVFGAAGGNEGGSLERVQVAGCVADGIGQLGLLAREQLETEY